MSEAAPSVPSVPSGNRRLRLLRHAATVCVLAGTGVFLWLERYALEPLARLEAWEFAALAASLASFFVVSGWMLAVLVRVVGVDLRPVQWLGLTLVTNALNYLGPARLGLVFKALYLKQRRLSYARFSAVVAATFFLSLFFTGGAGLTALAGLSVATEAAPRSLVWICLACVAAGAAPWLLADRVRLGRPGGLAFVSKAVTGFREIGGNRGTLLVVGGAVLAQHVLSAVSCLISFRALGFELGLWMALCLGVFGALSNLVAITPNNIGIQEIAMAYVYSAAGLDFIDGLLGVGLIRAVHLIVSFVGGVAVWLGVPEMAGTVEQTVAGAFRRGGTS